MTFFTHPIADFLTLLHNLIVIPVVLSVQRTELLKIQQAQGENIGAFYARVRGKAINCKFQSECTAPHVDALPGQHVYVNYTNEIIHHVLIAGLYDLVIRREIFGINNLDITSVNDLVSTIEGREMARDATSRQPNTVHAVSQFKQSKKGEYNRSPVNFAQKGKCSNCKQTLQIFKMANGRYNQRPFTECYECWRKMCQSTNKDAVQQSSANASDVNFELTVINDESNVVASNGTSTNILHHHVLKMVTGLRRVLSPIQL